MNTVEPLLCRFRPGAGLVTSSQTFVRRCHQRRARMTITWRTTGSGCSSQCSLTSHLNHRFDRVFEIARVVGRGLVSIAEVHAIVAGAQLAQGKAKMARDRFGFLERHGFVCCHRGTVAVELPAKRRS
jgi:hypothetical protein